MHFLFGNPDSRRLKRVCHTRKIGFLHAIPWSLFLWFSGVSDIVAADYEEFGFDEPLIFESPSTSKLNRHERLSGTRTLSPDEAESVYQHNAAVVKKLLEASSNDIARGYSKWQRGNSKPYPSFSHGRRYLNNYLNDSALNYLEYENAGRLPVGAVIVKESFAVAQNGAFLPGPLFIMEKMPAGFSYVSGDWRYTQIQPDGSVTGSTNGQNASRVRFCVSCHLAAEKKDHLFFIPTEYRR